MVNFVKPELASYIALIECPHRNFRLPRDSSQAPRHQQLLVLQRPRITSAVELTRVHHITLVFNISTRMVVKLLLDYAVCVSNMEYVLPIDYSNL